MELFRDETEYTDIRMVQRVADMFGRYPHIQRIGFGFLGLDYEVDVSGEDYGNWTHGHSGFHGYPRRSDRGLGGRSYQPPQRYYTSADDPSSDQAKDSDTETKAGVTKESRKNKAERKRLKKQKQKERKRLEKLEKEKQNPVKNEEGNDVAQEPKQDNTNNSSDTLSVSAKDTDTSDGSERESSDEDGDSEELDMTSTFVSKAALIARRQLEKKPRPEWKEKKKIPDKEEHKTVPDKPNEDQEAGKKDVASSSSPTFEDNVKISTDLAVIGNKFASAGDFNMAVKYFTDAIKYNPTEFKLFGNRSFCFEKLQEYDKALTDAVLSLGICPGWVKGLFRKGRALAGLKRYEEAADAFRDVLKLDSSYAEVAQELMRVQITQLMESGFTREQSSNALIIHGTVKKAFEVLSKLSHRPGAIPNDTFHPARVAGVSPVLSANTNPPHPPLPQSQDAPKTTPTNEPLGPVHNMPNVHSQSKPIHTDTVKTNFEHNRSPPELFPVWVGNLNFPATENMIASMFKKVGVVYSVKVLTVKRCAFVNFTKREYCDEAIQRFNGVDFNGGKLAVRYPDRIAPGMGISRSALKADDLQDENVRQYEFVDGGSRRPVRPYKHVPEHGGNR
ncbi:tetratricopeptide repeat protein 31-like [Brachyistius frenatus]|uniref:tetratricopeptide repeat protein 31-like n=1 Tax=Brachyistius frenatus TaxID=100188 RepID=UPI0037E87C3A